MEFADNFLRVILISLMGAFFSKTKGLRLLYSHRPQQPERFALGALLAVEFIKDRKGFFGMKDVLGL
jgi:dihydrodipicolinate reductase